MNKEEWEEFLEDNWIGYTETPDGRLVTDARIVLSFDGEGDLTDANEYHD